jgi:hypothetical protein
MIRDMHTEGWRVALSCWIVGAVSGCHNRARLSADSQASPRPRMKAGRQQFHHSP